MVEHDRKYDVYGIGNALVDLICTVDDGFLARMKIDKGLMTLIDRERHDELLPHLTVEKMESGGSVANSMIALSRCGAKGFFSCKVADDETGHFYLDDFKRAGVDTNLVKGELGSGVSGKCMVMVTPDADRTFHTHLGASETLSHAELSEEHLRQSRYLYVEGYLAAQKEGTRAAVRAMEIAREHGVGTALTFSDINMLTYFREAMDAIIGDGVDLIFCNEGEACEYAGTEDLGAACDRLKNVAKAFAITRGPRGALLFDGWRQFEIPAKRVNAVDTVGAGDMFAGTFLYGLVTGRSFEDAGALASTAASTVVTRFGPRLTAEEIENVLKEYV